MESVLFHSLGSERSGKNVSYAWLGVGVKSTTMKFSRQKDLHHNILKVLLYIRSIW